jgi:DNA polymerase-3 subunit gamma/tau
MEQYIVSARKYRPSTFESVVGQGALTSTLKNAIATDRLAHAYLFCGSRGVGKTSCARIFAKTINCKNRTANGEACNECDSCRAFDEGNSMNIIELDAASHNGIEDMKALVEQVRVPPTSGKYRVFIIDEVHMLTTQAFNAFLKTLEEPPSYVVFILATTEKHKIIPTILSRCQIYDFNRIGIPDMIAHLQRVAAAEGITAEPSALHVIARQADGAMRDALSIFDQVAASSRGNITYQSTIENLNVLDTSYYSRLLDAFVAKDIPQALLVFHEVRRKGFDAQFFLNGLGQYMRDLMLAGTESTKVLLDAPDDVKDEMAARAKLVTSEFLYGAMSLCNDADLNYRQSSNKQLLVELTLIKIAQLLSPSPTDRGRGEGLKPISKPTASQATVASAQQPSTAQQPAPAAQAAKPAPVAAPAPAQPIHHIPVAPQAPAPQRPTANTMRVGSISIHGVRQAAQPAAHASQRTQPYTAAQVKLAWEQFIINNPTEHALVNLMRQGAPAPDDRRVYSVTLANIVQVNMLNEHKVRVNAAIRDAIQNDSFDFEILKGEEVDMPRFWSDHQVLQYMLEHNPDVADFYRDFKLVLR